MVISMVGRKVHFMTVILWIKTKELAELVGWKDHSCVLRL